MSASLSNPSRINPHRRLLLLGSASAAAAASVGMPVMAAPDTDSAGIDVFIELRAVPDQVQIRPGTPTRVWRYQSKLLRGEASALEASAGGYLGPIIRVRRGQRIRIDLVNGLPESTIVHWHGLHVPDEMDGHPRFVIGPGERYVYDFKVDNRAGSYWFHPHPHGRTGKQVYAGLAGLFLISDDEYASVKAGFVDEGWKDTVLVMPGERVRLLLRFTDHAGLFLYHCHMLEHEDTGLMRNYRVVA